MKADEPGMTKVPTEPAQFAAEAAQAGWSEAEGAARIEEPASVAPRNHGGRRGASQRGRGAIACQNS
jgi:hypothetical protein